MLHTLNTISYLTGSVELLTAANDRPQKLFLAKITLAWFDGIFLTLYPHFRANFTAVSHASTPEFMGNSLSYPNMEVMYSLYLPSGFERILTKIYNLCTFLPSWSEWNARDARVSLLAWSVSAAMICGWQWPWLTAEYADKKSRYFFPSKSQTWTPNPFDNITGIGW